MITMSDICATLSKPVSPVYINALVLFNGILLPTFVLLPWNTNIFLFCFVGLIWFFTSTQQSFSYAGRFFLGLTSTKLG